MSPSFQRAFVNPADGRLRAGWRILAFVAVLMALAVGGQLALKAAVGGIPKSPVLRNAAIVLLAAIAASIAVPLARRRLDRKTVVSLGLRWKAAAAGDLVFGFLLSGSMAAAIFFTMLQTGLIEPSYLVWGRLHLGMLLVLLLIDVVIGWWEELVFRGYLLQNLIEGLGLPLAVGVSCVLYGLVHAANPNAGVLSTAIIVLFGFLRIYGYLATRQLWLSIGMHTGWNFFQGPVFGYAASGHEGESLIEHAPAGPSWLSGGAFGPEASVLTIPVVGLALLAMRSWAGRRALKSQRAGIS